MTVRDLIQRKGGDAPARRGRERSIGALHDEVNRLFDEFFGGFGLAPREPWFMGGGGFTPRVDISETEEELTVTSELPGLDEDDVHVELDEHSLTISGEKREEHEEKGRHAYRAERTYGSFRRLVPLPAKVDAAKAKAAFRNGVLTVTLPKVAESRMRVKIDSE